jgi:DNA polymerase III gamma/tau subunit
MLSEMESKLRTSLSTRTLVEMTLIRCARTAKMVSLDEVIRRLNDLRTQTIQRLAAVAPSRPTAATAAPSPSAAPQPVTAPSISSPSQPPTPPSSSFIPPTLSDEALDPIDEDMGYVTEEASFIPPPASPEMRTIKVETLQKSDGKYVDEILNLAVRMFNGSVVSIQERIH